jgi:hypothetical protein
MTQDGLVDEAAVVVDLKSGRVRALRRYTGPGGLGGLAWSPDGRLVALSYAGTMDGNDVFSVIEVSSGRSLFDREWSKGSAELAGRPVWASDSRSLFVMSQSDWPNGIARLYVDGDVVTIVEKGRPDITHFKWLEAWLEPWVADSASLTYTAPVVVGQRIADGVYRYDVASGRRDLLFSRGWIGAVVPLARLP